MFRGDAKQGFGATSTNGFGFNSTPTASPFGAQTTFGKPATTGFGQTNTFGQQNTSLFGNQQAGSLFGGTPAATFGNPPTTQSGFNTLGGFGQTQPQNNSLFGAPPQPNQNTSLFGQPSTSAFGLAKPTGFGFGTQQPTSLFGQASTSTAQSTGFGGFGTNATSGGGVFGTTTTGFGQTQPGANGSALAKYQPTLGTDTLLKNGQSNNVNTKQHCITAMKEYESRCLEEIRMEDYMANRKGPQAGSIPSGGGMFGSNANTGGIFGAPASQPSTGLFGQQTQPVTNTLGGFGSTTNTLGGFVQQTSAFGQPVSQPSTGLFGKPFAAPATSTAPFGGFGNPAANTNPFGAKPFGQPATGSLFGQPAVSGAPAFGQTNTAFGSFGQTSVNQPAPLFGQSTTTNTGGFGLTSSAPNTAFGFGTNTNVSTAGGGIFGQKPITGFGATTGFGVPTSTATGFGAFGQTNTSGSLFNNSFNKPAVPTFGGFGTQAAAPTLGGGLGLGTGSNSLFGNIGNKPGGLFATNTAPTGSNTLFGSTFNTNNNLGMGSNTFGMGQGLGNMQQAATIPIHQQILALTTSPYGDNPIFKDLKPFSGLNEDALKPTNPAAQKAILESSNQFKISPKVGSGLKLKPVGSMLTKKSLFGGLEEFDSSVEESFSLKPNAKRLIIKTKSSPLTSNNSLLIVYSANQSKSTDTKNINSRNNTPTHQSKDKSASEESFSNQIPTTVPSAPTTDFENGRRVSWLHSNALEKVTKQNRMSDYVLDNTIDELVTGNDKGSLDKNTNIDGENSPPSKDNDSIIMPVKSAYFTAQTSSDSISSTTQSFLDETNTDLSLINVEAHPTGIILQRAKYYTIPSMDKLIDYITEDGSCIVPNFTIGRKGYGNVYFNEPIDVAGLNLDELVHFRHKEVIIYPDDENKPPVGTELNRKAQITLDQVWPHDKTKHEPIKDKYRLEAMEYEEKLRRVCDKHDMRFIEYRPETGSWVFRVEHFSKYGLSDSDDDDVPVDPKKVKLTTLPAQSNDQTVAKKSTGTIPKIKKTFEQDSDVSLPQHGLGGYSAENENYNIDFGNERGGIHKIAPMSPSAEIAMDIGTDAHKLQLMKASFFVDDEYDRKSVISEQVDGRDSPDQIVPHRAIFRHLHTPSSHLLSKGIPSTASSSVIESPLESPNVAFKEVEVQRQNANKLIKPIGPKSIPLIVKPKIALVKMPGTVIPLHNSVGFNLQGKCASDIAFMHSRKFKIGWALQNTLVMCNTVQNSQNIENESNMEEISHIFKGRSISDISPAVLQYVKISSTNTIDSFQESIENHLETQLKFCKKEKLENSDCPYFIADGGTLVLKEHYYIAKINAKLGDIEEYVEGVWSLCDTLWGDQEDLEGHHINSHHTVTRRKELLSDWLESVIEAKSDHKNAEISSASGYLDRLLSLLSCHKVVEACELAFNYNDINLSFLLAQLSGGPTVRQLIQHQLSSWQDIEADKFITIDRIKSLMLVAGIPLISSSHGTINIYENMDWLKAFAMNVWYLCSTTSSVTDALVAYEQSFQANDFHAAAPTPPYMSEYLPEQDRPMEDLRYHILKLYSKRSHPLESLLNPATHTSNSMDFRLSWLLLQVLKAIGYHHCSELSESQLHVSFAAQLENQGLWHWSIFVLLHIKNQSQRELAVQNILYRYITLSQDAEYMDKENFIINELGIPKKWIYWAKAVRAGAMNKYHALADYLLKAKQWALAHNIIMLHIAPDAVINDNMPYLSDLLERFEDARLAPNWANQGMILLDYMEIIKKLNSLKTIHEDDMETRWEGLKPQLSELCSRINLFPCPTSKHRLCQSEIAQRLANLVSGIRIMSPELDPCALIKITLEKLPLPQEYAQKKLRTLLEDNFLMDVLQKRKATI